jgi:uncharacterized protein
VKILIDTGPLVAMLVARERHHAWTVARLEELEPPLLTCEAVISEACYLVRQLSGGRDAVLSLLARGVVKVTFSLTAELEAVRKLMQRYASVPMSLADACLVRMAETYPRSPIFTLDSDFQIYRRGRRQALPLMSPL